MQADQLFFIWMIISVVSVFAAVFGMRYMISRENMALIEKGINPKIKSPSVPKPFLSLKWGLLLVGCGMGLFIAYLLDNFALYNVEYKHPDANSAIYFALIAMGGGLGLILSYRIEKKEVLDKEK